MRIGLIDVDSKIPNLALMKLSAHHKARGDSVEWYSPLMIKSYDQVYASKVFTWSKYPYMTPENTLWGGSGSNRQISLLFDVEHVYPDYSLYGIDYAMGYITRGCVNNCPFCIVRKKEGLLKYNAKLSEFWNGQKELMLLDNALTDYKDCIGALVEIRYLGIKLNLCQGFNVRSIKREVADVLVDIKRWKGKQWHIAWDNPKDEKLVMDGILILNDAGIYNHELMCYVLVNYNTSIKQDVYRVDLLDKMGLDPFVMIYQGNPVSKEVKDLARWCNRPQIRAVCTYEEYKKRKKRENERCTRIGRIGYATRVNNSI
jgi:hypothetical protein